MYLLYGLVEGAENTDVKIKLFPAINLVGNILPILICPHLPHSFLLRALPLFRNIIALFCNYSFSHIAMILCLITKELLHFANYYVIPQLYCIMTKFYCNDIALCWNHIVFHRSDISL